MRKENNFDTTAEYTFFLVFLFFFREKPPSMMDKDFNCSPVCIGNALSSSVPAVTTPGLTSPPYVATPCDHDYAKRKTLRRQQWQQQRHEEQQADGTVSVLGVVGVGLLPFLHWDRRPSGERSDC